MSRGGSGVKAGLVGVVVPVHALRMKFQAFQLLLSLVVFPLSAQDFQFNEISALFTNPGQGWMSPKSPLPNAPEVPSSVTYIRFDWADVEPQEGVYDWSIIDRALADVKRRGATVSIRVMTANAHSKGTYSSPKWLFDLGCKSYEYTVGGDDPTSGGKRILRIEPDYSDPLYLEKHGEFLKAMGARYNGSPDVEFLDIGSYGIWGEWHTTHPASVDVRKKIVDLYLSAFPQTPLMFMTDDFETLPYALAHGVGMRRDGVGSPWHADNWIGSKRYAGVPEMADAWKKAPVVFEWYGDYNYLLSKNWSFDEAVRFMLLNHVTMINDNIGTVPPVAQDKVWLLSQMAGYRFVLKSGSYRLEQKQLQVSMNWANVGVGKLYRAFELHLALRTKDGEIVAETAVADDPRGWLPGEHQVNQTWKLPENIKAGDYSLTLAIVDPSGHFLPLHLAMDAPEVKGWSRIGKLTVPE